MIKTNNIFRIITLLCIAFTMFLAECKSAYSFSLKSIFDQKSSTEDKEDGNKTFSLDSAYQDSSARIAGFNELFDNRPEAERFYFCSGFNSAEIEGFSNTVNINQNLANRVSVNFMLMTFGTARAIYNVAGSNYELSIYNTGRNTFFQDATTRQYLLSNNRCKDLTKLVMKRVEQIPPDMLMMWGKQDIDRFIGNPSQSGVSKIPSKLVLDISKPIYEKNENISLLAQWTGADVDCKILEEKVKETLDNRHFEIVDNSISCAGNDNKSLIQLRVQFKSPRIGKLNIPAITLENNISSNSVDFSVRDLEALQNAVVSKNIESIKAFLSAPEDLDAIKIDGEHPVAHFIKDDMGFAQELIRLGASPDVIDKNGYTPLMYAVIRQNNEFLDLLLDKNAYLNELDKKGRTAIMYAAIKNNIYAAKKLVEHKADIYKSKDGKWTAYQYAKEMKHTEIASLLKSPLNEILIIFDGCSSCEKKIKSLEKIVKQQYPIMNISYIRYTPQDCSNKYDHFPDQNYPIIKRKRQKDSDDFGSNSGNILGNWDGTEKQLEKIMYKEL